MFIASLPWYDFPSTRRHLDSVYQQLRQQLILAGVDREQLTPQLDRQIPLYEQWSDRRLLLSQCCGPDLHTPAGRALKIIARPVFDTLDCPAGYYFSHIVSGSKKPGAHPVIVVNSQSSFSGCVALLKWLDKTGRNYKQAIVSNAHQNSIDRLRSGEADVAAIDAYSWQFLDHDGLEIIDQSETAPSPPFVCHQDCSVDLNILATALEMAIREQGRPLHITELAATDNLCYPMSMTDRSQPVARPRLFDCSGNNIVDETLPFE